ncbi:unnamed protein product [Meganyctiphanes norvegica]|uniref:Uncharacterized protein n=1 Tax=Meganyctiphanes norvegica TaxID=48144 RepID=A0AAV2QTW6_MEGNR
MWMQRYIVALCLLAAAFFGLGQGTNRKQRGQGRSYKKASPSNVVNSRGGEGGQAPYTDEDDAGGGYHGDGHGSSHHRRHGGAAGGHHSHQNPDFNEPYNAQQCPECNHVDMRKLFRIQQIQQRFLTATGLRTEPNMTGVVKTSNPNVEDLINRVERRQHDSALLQDTPSYDDEPEVKTERIFVTVEPGNSHLQMIKNSLIRNQITEWDSFNTII